MSGSLGTLWGDCPRARGLGVLKAVTAGGTLGQKCGGWGSPPQERPAGSVWGLGHLPAWRPGPSGGGCASCPCGSVQHGGPGKRGLDPPWGLAQGVLWWVGKGPQGQGGRWTDGGAGGCRSTREGRACRAAAPPGSQVLPLSPQGWAVLLEKHPSRWLPPPELSLGRSRWGHFLALIQGQESYLEGELSSS